jgi:hypothetical protein
MYAEFSTVTVVFNAPHHGPYSNYPPDARAGFRLFFVVEAPSQRESLISNHITLIICVLFIGERRSERVVMR